jgi:NADH-quinone oxidoreductase subunit E
MSSLHNNIEQPASFEFSAENLLKAEEIINKYPYGCQQSAVMPLLDLAQRQHNNWIPRAAMEYIAKMLHMPPVKVYELATFYSMYNTKPVGKYLLQICRTTPCWLNGADAVTVACQKRLGIKIGESTEDGKFTLMEVECLGACVHAPIIQINDSYHENVTAESINKTINELSED